jgi:REP element-mobilizing transposase RayT
MPNHFHFFLRINDFENFEKGIKSFFISYAKAINKKYDRVGGLFQGRYKCLEINSIAYFTRIVTYIHQNPIAANFVKKLEDYKFSSYVAYLSPNQKSVIKRDEVIEWFGDLNNFVKWHENY